MNALPDSEAKLRFLRSAAAWGRDAPPAQLIETHMSWVLLCGARVLKLKKPVRHAFLDFASVAARERNARAEVRLNRRLAPQVYLGVVALQWDGHQFALVPDGALRPDAVTVDWLVQMQRLPAESMLDRCIATASVRMDDIAALAATLAAFYRRVEPVLVSADEYVARMQSEQRDNRALLLEPRFRDPIALAVLDRYDDALAAHRDLVAARAPHVVDGHGDLRPEHVCLLRPPVVIDCLEFNATLRQVDPCDELAFLGLECEVAGASWIGPALWTRCTEALADAAPARLRHLYAARRALLRSRLMVAHLLDPQPHTPERWLPRARVYLQHAEAALQRLKPE